MAEVLVVDDDSLMAGFLSEALCVRGHRVTAFTSGDQALAHLKSCPKLPDLILLDVLLPGLDGFTLHRLLQEDDQTKRIPVIVLSARGRLRPAFELSPNVTAFLEKPFDLHALYQAVQGALALRKEQPVPPGVAAFSA